MNRRSPAIARLEREDEEETRLFWMAKSPEERLSAVEFLREQFYVIQGMDAPPSIVFHIRVLEPAAR